MLIEINMPIETNISRIPSIGINIVTRNSVVPVIHLFHRPTKKPNFNLKKQNYPYQLLLIKSLFPIHKRTLTQLLSKTLIMIQIKLKIIKTKMLTQIKPMMIKLMIIKPMIIEPKLIILLKILTILLKILTIILKILTIIQTKIIKLKVRKIFNRVILKPRNRNQGKYSKI